MSGPAIVFDHTSKDAELNAALAKAQGEFPSITKSKTVKTASYEYSYAPLDEILDACRPVLSRHGLALVQLLEQNGDGPAIRTELRHASGGVVGSSFPLPRRPETPQQLGSMLTYLRRYAIVALLAVAPEEDDDGQQAAEAKEEKKPARKPAKPKQEDVPVSATPAARVLQISQILNDLEELDSPPEGAENWKQVAEQWVRREFGPTVTLGGLTAERADRLIEAMGQHREQLRLQADWEQAGAVDVEEIEF